jgi:3-dehydroquinate synthase
VSDIATLRVELGARSYEIAVGSDLIARAGALMAPVLASRRVVVVTDETVAALHLTELETSLDEAGIQHHRIVLPPGETTKDFAHLEQLIDDLLAAQVDRGTTLVALGGGVIGDIAGFAASIVLRSIDLVQVPTTLLAQVDSSVGGKTAINARQGKNLIGAFYQPRLVLADTGVLATLPRRQLLAGYAEVVKYGLINDPDFFAWLEANGTQLLTGDAAALQQAVITSCAAKAAIVSADERETGERALLNLGHTFGHALEAETRYNDSLLHGEAVAIGMVMAFDLSVRLGLCAVEEAERVRRHFTSIGLPVALPEGGNQRWTSSVLLRHMGQDKKVRDGKITFILARGIGRAFITRDIAPESVRELLEQAIAA